MRIFAYVDKGVDLAPLKKKLAPHINIEWVEEDIIDYKAVHWEPYHYGAGSISSLGINRAWIKGVAELAHQEHGEHIDVVAFFVADDNWQDGQNEVWGWHVETPFSGYQTIQVRVNHDWTDTAWHEIMHTLDNIIQIETGVNISEKLGVTSYDEDIVHSPRGRNNANWHKLYAKTLKTVKPYLEVAIVARRERFKQSLLETALRLARTLLAQLQARLVELPPAPAKPLEPIVAHKAEQLIALAKLHDINLRITSGHRSHEEQDALYAQGRTKPGNIVTNAKGGESLHNYAVAFDVVDRQRGYDTDWELIGTLGKTLGLEWGGDWTDFVDRPHFQYTAGYTLKDFQSGQVDSKELNTESHPLSTDGK